MGSKVSVRDNKKPTLKKARFGGDGDDVEAGDNVTLMDMIRSFRKPMRRRRRPARLVEEDEDEVRVIADVDSSSDEEGEKVRQHFKRKRKRRSRDLYELLQSAPPVRVFTPDREDYERPQPRKQKKQQKSNFSNEMNVYDADVCRDGILEVILGSPPPSVPHAVQKLAGSPITYQTDDTREMNPQCGRGNVRRSMEETWVADKGVGRMGSPVVKGEDGTVRRHGDEKRGRGRRVLAQPPENLETFKKQRNSSRKKVAGTCSDRDEHFAPSLAWSNVAISSGQTYLGGEYLASHESDSDDFAQEVEVVVQLSQDAIALELKEELSSQSHLEVGVAYQAQDATALESKEDLSFQSHVVEEDVVQQTQHSTALELREELSSQNHYGEGDVVQHAQHAKAQALTEEFCSQGRHVEECATHQAQDATAQEFKEELSFESHNVEEGLAQQTQDCIALELKEELSSQNLHVEEEVVQQAQYCTVLVLTEELCSQSQHVEECVAHQTQESTAQELKEDLCSDSHLVEEDVVQEAQYCTALELKEELSSQNYHVEEDEVNQAQHTTEELREEFSSQSQYVQWKKVFSLSSQNHYAKEDVVQQAQDAKAQELREELCSQSHHVEEGVAQQGQDATEEELKEVLSSHRLEDGDVKQGEHELPAPSECDAGNQTKLNGGAHQGVGVAASPRSKEDVRVLQMPNAVLRSLEEGLAAGQTAEISDLCLSSPGPSQLPGEFVCSQRVDSPSATPSELREESELVEEDVGLHPTHGNVEEVGDVSSRGPNLQPEALVCSQRVHSPRATTFEQREGGSGELVEEDVGLHPTHGYVEEVCDLSSPGPSMLREDFICSQRVHSPCATTLEQREGGDSGELVEEDFGFQPTHGIVEEVCDLYSPGPNLLRDEFVCAQRVDSPGAATFHKLEEGDSAERLDEDAGLHPSHAIVEDIRDLSSSEPNQLRDEFACSPRVDSTGAATIKELGGRASCELVEEYVGLHPEELVFPQTLKETESVDHVKDDVRLHPAHDAVKEVCDFSSSGLNHPEEELVCPLRVGSGDGATFERLEERISAAGFEDEVVLHAAHGIVEEERDFSSPRPNQPAEEFICAQPMDCAGATTYVEKLEGACVGRVEGDVCLHPGHGIVEVECGDLTPSVDYGNHVAEADDSCEKAGEDALDFPVLLSQPRGRITEDECIEDTVNGEQGASEAAFSLPRSIARASLKAKKISWPVGGIVVSVTESSPPQSLRVEPALPECALNSECAFKFADGCESPVPEKRRTAVSEQSLPLGVITVPLISDDAEFEQIEGFNYVTLQEEWQNAGKFLDPIELSLFEKDVAASTPRKRKLCDPENFSDQVKRVAIEAVLQQKVPFGRVEDTSPEKVQEEDSMEDEHVPTALSKAIIERNGERRLGRFPGPVDEKSPSTERLSNAYEKPDRATTRQKRKALLEEDCQLPNGQMPNSSPRCLAQTVDPLLDGERALTDRPEPSPESNCDPVTVGDSEVCVDLLASEKLGDEESSQDFEPPSKLPCRRKTMSPLSQMELMRASDSTSPPAHESPTQKIPAFRVKLTGGLAGRHEEASPIDCEPTADCSSFKPNNETGKCDASNDAVVSLDSSEDDTEDISCTQVHGPEGLGEEPSRKFSLCLSTNSPSPSTSPESLTADSSQNTSSQDPRDSQSLGAASSKGILKTGAPSCKGLCKCPKCSTSRSKAGTAADFVASQMKTFQLIAGRLTNDIQSLRGTIETNLLNHGETGKIQETLQKSKGIEEAAEKNLLALLRDCKRYCKLTKTKPVTVRKIVFADEAGKELCHVKTFQSPSIPKSVLDLL